MLATIQALQLDLDSHRGTNGKQLVQLQEQQCAVEQEHQDLVILMQQFQALMGKVLVLAQRPQTKLHVSPTATPPQARHHACPTACANTW